MQLIPRPRVLGMFGRLVYLKVVGAQGQRPGGDEFGSFLFVPRADVALIWGEGVARKGLLLMGDC
jgi:hypothetical protein